MDGPGRIQGSVAVGGEPANSEPPSGLIYLPFPRKGSPLPMTVETQHLLPFLLPTLLIPKPLLIGGMRGPWPHISHQHSPQISARLLSFWLLGPRFLGYTPGGTQDLCVAIPVLVTQEDAPLFDSIPQSVTLSPLSSAQTLWTGCRVQSTTVVTFLLTKKT